MSKLIFESDFSEPDPRWQTRHTPTPDLVAGENCPKYTRKSRLQLRLCERNGEVRTSHVGTLGRAFQHGYFEARMKFTGPRGAHSCFWLQDVVPNQLGGSEVDIAEHFGGGSVWHNVYWRTPETMWPLEPTRWRVVSTAIDPYAWHTYGVDWRADGYTFTVDGEERAWTDSGTSSLPKIMILSNLSSKWEWPRLERGNLGQYRTLVDWVKVWE